MFLKFFVPFRNFATDVMKLMPKSDTENGSIRLSKVRQLAIDECSSVAGGPQVRNDSEE